MICVTVFTNLWNWFHNPWFWFIWFAPTEIRETGPSRPMWHSNLFSRRQVPVPGASPIPRFWSLVHSFTSWFCGWKTTQGRNAGMFRRFQASHKTPNTSYIVLSVLQLWHPQGLQRSKFKFRQSLTTQFLHMETPWPSTFCFHVQQMKLPMSNHLVKLEHVLWCNIKFSSWLWRP